MSYTRFEDFEKEYPAFADLRPGEVRGDAHCYYYRGKKQHLYVYRWPKMLGPEYYPKTRHLFERHVPRGPPKHGQKTLQVGAMAPKKERAS